MAKLNGPARPKHITDLQAIELIWGPPERVLKASDMRVYQKWMTSKIKFRKKVYLGAEMGLGKTGSVLKAISDLLKAGSIERALIVAPLYVAEETWPEEIQKWEFARWMRYRVVTGTEEERIAALRYGPCEITIVNRENLLWLINKIGLKRWNFDFIGYDEATRLNHGRKRTLGTQRKDGTVSLPRLTDLGILDRVRHKTEYLVELSGTPTPRGLINLYGPIYAIDGGKRLGSSLTAYKRRWFREDMYTKKIEPFEHSQGEILSRLKDVFYSLKTEDYLDLPPLVEVPHKVVLPPRVMKKYREFEREQAIEVANRQGDPVMIEAVNRGVLTNKLLQFANGSLYDENGDDHPIHSLKLDVLKSIFEEACGRPILVAYSFQFDKTAILKRFPMARVFGDSTSDKRDWNAGKIPMMLLHPAAAGHGLNFQYGSNIAVWYGLTWNLELYQQFIKRLWRSGQEESRVFLHKILAQGTADYDVVDALDMKGATQDSITDAVRVRLARAA